MKYFTIKELTRSMTAERLGINNCPTKEIETNMTELVDCLLDSLRELWGGALIVTSGYRCKALNTAVGGVVNSHHLRGMAADLVPIGGIPADCRRLINVLTASSLKWTQAILERNCRGSTWVHVAYDRVSLRKEVLYL